MVSVKRASLPQEYIDAAKQLIYALEGNSFTLKDGFTCRLNNGNGYKIDYAFFYLRYDEDQQWYDGDWRLAIATNDFCHDLDGVEIINSVIELLDIKLDEFEYSIGKPNWENDKRAYDRVYIKTVKPN